MTAMTAKFANLYWNANIKLYTLFMLPTLLLAYLTALSNAQAADVDPTAPLDVLKKAREAAGKSNINFEDATSTGQAATNLLLVTAVVIGFACALFSGVKLYNNIQAGDQARGSNILYIVGLAVGSLITIIGVIVGFFTNFATGGAT